MSDETQQQASQEPAPIKESDANRVTADEAKRAEPGREEGSEKESKQGDGA